jgi:hypothetical protein
MRKRMMPLSMLVLAVTLCPTAFAEETKPASPPAADAGTPVTKSHEVEAEVVAVDGEKNTITLKTAAGEATSPVDAKAQASLSSLKPGQKVTVVCRDDDKGDHKAVEASISARLTSTKWLRPPE